MAIHAGQIDFIRLSLTADRVSLGLVVMQCHRFFLPFLTSFVRYGIQSYGPVVIFAAMTHRHATLEFQLFLSPFG